MPPKRGRPSKQKRNISGLRNQQPKTQKDATPMQRAESPDWDSDLALSDTDDMDEEDQRFFDSLFGDADADTTKESEEPEDPNAAEVVKDSAGFDSDWEADMDDEQFTMDMMELAERCGDDADDEDWVPLEVKRQRERRRAEKRSKIAISCKHVLPVIQYVLKNTELDHALQIKLREPNGCPNTKLP